MITLPRCNTFRHSSLQDCLYESDDDWEEKAPAPKRRKSTATGFPKCSLPPSPPSPPLKDPSPEVPPKKYVKPWTKVIGTAVFEIYDYGNNNTTTNNNNNNNNITKLDVYNNNNGDKDVSEKVKVKEQGHLAASENLSNDISTKSSSFSPVENKNGLVVNNSNVSWSSNTLEERRRSCLGYGHDDDNEAADSDFCRSKTTNISSSSAPPRLVVGSIDTSAASFPERSDYHDEASAATTNGKQQHRDSEPQQQHQHDGHHHQTLQPPPTPQSPQSPPQLQPPSLKPASQHCNYCAVLNSTCERCALHDTARKGDACHKISPIKLSLSTESNDWYISPDNNDKGAVKETTCKDTDSIGYNTTEGAIKGQELGSLPLSPASLTSEGEEENKSPSLLAGSRNLTLEVPSPNHDTKGWYQSSCGSGGVSPSEDRWWRVPPKKRWLPNTGDYHGQVLVTDVTYNCVTVTFMESSTEKGFFKEYTDE